MTYSDWIQLLCIIPLTCIGIIVTLSAVLVSLYISRKSDKNLEKQLKIEQTPYVVAYGFFTSGKNELCIKNIGRGSAFNIRVSGEKPDFINGKHVFREAPFFQNNQSHTKDLGPQQSIEDWLVQPVHFVNSTKKYINPKYPQTIFIYIRFLDQLGYEYITRSQYEVNHPHMYEQFSNDGNFGTVIKHMQSNLL